MVQGHVFVLDWITEGKHVQVISFTNLTHTYFKFCGKVLVIHFINSFKYYRCSVKAQLWDAMIAELEPVIQGTVEHPAVVIFANIKMKMFRSILVLSSIASSRIYINPAHNAVTSIRDRYILYVLQSHHFFIL